MSANVDPILAFVVAILGHALILGVFILWGAYIVRGGFPELRRPWK